MRLRARGDGAEPEVGDFATFRDGDECGVGVGPRPGEPSRHLTCLRASSNEAEDYECNFINLTTNQSSHQEQIAEG